MKHGNESVAAVEGLIEQGEAAWRLRLALADPRGAAPSPTHAATTVDAASWHERWALGQIGFHQEAIHPLLLGHWPQLRPKDGEGVFVPLCGKSHDMRWLQEHGHPVVGVDLSPLAVEQFFADTPLQPVRSQLGPLERHEAGNIALYCGDFFALQPSEVASCGLVYDRGALGALPPEVRPDYVKHLRLLFPHGARSLLVTFDYPPHEMSGPPFAVTEAEVRELYDVVRLLARHDVLADYPLGLSELHETAYLVEWPGR